MVALLFTLALLFAVTPLAAFADEPLPGASAVDRSLEGTTLNVYNWGEYISDGSDDSLDVVKNFEALTGITVNYSTFASNEDMYAKLKAGAVSYDIVIPSDYMVAQLIEEELVQKIDVSKIPNLVNINADFRNLYYDPTNEYSVPYSYGMVGLIYNTTLLAPDEVPDSWSIMWDSRYAGEILNFNNPRDAFAIAQFLLVAAFPLRRRLKWLRRLPSANTQALLMIK